jgi:predicted MFS family arabinose efflux permease
VINPKRIAFFFLCLANTTISFNIAAVSAALPSIGGGLNLPDLAVAKLVPYYLIPYGMAALLYAPLARKWSVRGILLVTMALYGAASWVCGITDRLDVMLTARIIVGLTAAGVIPLGLMTIGSLFERHRRGRFVGLFFSCSFLASVAGLIVSGTLPWRWLFLVPAAIAFCTAAGLALARPEKLRRLSGKKISYREVLQNGAIVRVLVFIFLMSFFYHAVHKWFGIYLHRVYHLQQSAISMFIVLTAVSGAIGQLLGGVITDKKGRRFACDAGIVFLGAATALLSTQHSLPVLGLVLIVFSVGWTVGHNGISTVLTDFPDEYRAELASLNSAVRFLSGGFGFYLSGFFIERSFSMTFLVIGVLIFILSLFVKRVVPAQQH